VKIINEKILIFPKQNSSKADLIYDIRECLIKGHYLTEELMPKRKLLKMKTENIGFKKLIEIKTSKPNIPRVELLESKKEINYLSTNNIYTLNKNKIVDSADNLENLISTEDNTIKTSDNSGLSKVEKYEIEIEHPYLNNCLLQGDYISEVLDFYQKLRTISD